MNDMLIVKKEFDQGIQGYGVGGCCVRDKNIFYFVAHETESEKHPVIEQAEIKKRIIAFFRDDPEGNRLGIAGFVGFERLMCAAPKKPKAQLVAVDASGKPIIYGAGDKEFEDELMSSPTGPIRGGVRRVRTIGDHVYAVSGRRGVCKRNGEGKWESLCPEIEFETDEDKRDKQTEGWGFDDIDGFSENELYACGGAGDVWRMKDGNWKLLEFPTNQELESICCGGDGKVYIAGRSGTIFVGRDDKWKLLFKGSISLPYRDLVWYEDKLWGSNSYGLWNLVEDEMVPADLEPEIKVCAGHLSVADGVMLMAGGNGAAFREEGKWNLIFNVFQEALQ
ncbi:MAG: WD40/YVTN/BNR-like repeat-containing protein [Mariniblastus sp.]